MCFVEAVASFDVIRLRTEEFGPRLAWRPGGEPALWAASDHFSFVEVVASLGATPVSR